MVFCATDLALDSQVIDKRTTQKEATLSHEYDGTVTSTKRPSNRQTCTCAKVVLLAGVLASLVVFAVYNFLDNDVYIDRIAT